MSDQPTFEGMPVKLFSCTPSRLDTWLDCPRKYRYTYIDTPRPPRGGPWAHASMGAAVHNALREWWTKPLNERTTQVGEVLLTKFWRTDGFKDDEQAQRSFVRAKAWITNYLKTVDINEEPRGLERTVSAIGSNIFEGFTPTPKTIEIIRDYTLGLISLLELIQIAKTRSYE